MLLSILVSARPTCPDCVINTRRLEIGRRGFRTCRQGFAPCMDGNSLAINLRMKANPEIPEGCRTTSVYASTYSATAYVSYPLTLS